MTLDLDDLAQRIARELAGADRAGGTGTPSIRALDSAPRGGAPLELTARSVTTASQRPGGVAPPAGVSYVRSQARIADFIDHTLLKAEATRAEVEILCKEAVEHGFASVCVNPAWVPFCAERVRGSSVKVCTVIGFPLGSNSSETKAFEAALAVRQGAGEVDMVANVSAMKSGDWTLVARDVRAVVEAAGGALVKVIIESAALTPVEIIKASAIAREMGANYVKTSTGFHPAGGASAEAVALMRLTVGDALGVKASGGVRDCATALKMINAGATRIGTSSGVTMAQCLGPGPLPLGELLATADAHTGRCLTCAAPQGAGAY